MCLVSDLRTLLHGWMDIRVPVEETEQGAQVHVQHLTDKEIDTVIDSLHSEGFETERVKIHGEDGVTVGVIVHESDESTGLSQAEYQEYQEEVEKRFYDAVSE